MKYETKYKDSYQDGVRNISCTISGRALQLLQEYDIEAGSRSAFINDLIIDNLSEQQNNFFTRLKIAKINQEIQDLRKDGYRVDFNFEKIAVGPK